MTHPQNGASISTKHLKKCFLGHLGAFVLVSLSLSILSGQSVFLKMKDFQSAFDSTVFMWAAFAVGIAIALLGTAVFGKNLFTSLEQKLDMEHTINTQRPLLVSGDSLLIRFNVCFLIVILLDVFKDQLCPGITPNELKQKVPILTDQCLFHLEGLQSFVLGIGAGIACWSFLWTRKKENSTFPPILVNFYWTKHSSRELAIIVFSIILLYIVF